MFCAATLYFIIIDLFCRYVALCLLITRERLMVFLSRLRTTPYHRQVSTTRQLPPLSLPTAQRRPQNTSQHMTTATPITRQKQETRDASTQWIDPTVSEQSYHTTVQPTNTTTATNILPPLHTSTPVKVSARIEQDITPAYITMGTSIELDTSDVSYEPHASVRAMPLGNFLLAGAILFIVGPFSKFQNVTNILHLAFLYQHSMPFRVAICSPL